jgi:IclR family mhp operon transcriptional activator
MNQDQELKSLKRGLRALIALSRKRTITIAEAAAELDLPRTTAERILMTLESERFIFRDRHSKRFALAPRVLALARGFSDEDRLVEAATPILFRKTGEIGWPLAIAVASGDQMTVRVTTDSATSLGLHKRHVGSEIAMAASSSGLLHLAYLDGSERETMLNLLAASDDPAQALARNRPLLLSYLADARRDGFAISPDLGAERALSVPLSNGDGRVIAVLVLMYIARGVKYDALLSRYLPEMKTLAGDIEAAAFGGDDQAVGASARE